MQTPVRTLIAKEWNLGGEPDDWGLDDSDPLMQRIAEGARKAVSLEEARAICARLTVSLSELVIQERDEDRS